MLRFFCLIIVCLFIVVSYRENDILNKSKRVFNLHDCATFFLFYVCLLSSSIVELLPAEVAGKQSIFVTV